MATQRPPSKFIDAILEYAKRGFPVFPVPPGTKKSYKSAAHSGGVKWGATTDPDQIRKDFDRWPGANVGIPTGPSTFMVLDVDVPSPGGHKQDGTKTLADLEARYGALPATPRYRTASGGINYLFKCPEGLRNSAGILGPGLDIRGDGGMVVAVPSVRPGIGTYEWQVSMDDCPIADPPIWLIQCLTIKPAQIRAVAATSSRTADSWAVYEARFRSVLRDVAASMPGQRNDALNRAAFNFGQQIAAGTLDRDLAERELLTAANLCGLVRDDGEPSVVATIRSGMESGFKAPRPDDPEVVSQDYAAQIFESEYRHHFRYDHSAGSWYVWRQFKWERDATREVLHCCRELSRKLTVNQKAGVARDMGKAAFAYGIETLAKSAPQLGVTAAIWDQDPYLLGTPGGIVDLKTGALRPSSPEDYISKIAAVTPSNVADCPGWDRFLQEATGGDTGTVSYLKRWAGYILTGDTREHALLFLHGSGGNGKSVFLNTIASILGDYAKSAPMETFTASKGERHSTDLAMLKGARLVIASETDESQAWAESRIKTLTGGDVITARFLYKDNFEYRPQFKLVIAGNHKPALHGVGHAMRRRLRIVPFTYKPVSPDRQLEHRLRGEFPGILRWMIEGALEWQAEGLQPPLAVEQETNDYFEEQDVVGQFLDERCICGEAAGDGVTPTGSIYEAFTDFAARSGVRPMPKNALSASLQSRGFQPHRGRYRGFRGISLRSDLMM